MAKAKKLPSGSWRVQAYANGKTKSFTSPDRRTAELQAAQWQAGVMQSAEDMTLREAYARYIAAKEKVLSPSTIDSYIKKSKNNFQSIMSLKIERITDEQIQQAVNLLAAKCSPKTVRDNYGLLTAVLSMFRPSYRPNARLPQKIKTELYIPTKQEVKATLEAAKSTGYYIPVLLAACCGMRAGEICALTSDDISSNKITVNKSMVRDNTGTWHIKPPKSFSGNRNIEIPLTVKNALNGIQGKIVKYNPHSLSSGFHRLLKNNNLPLYRFHDLRHFYVSELFDMGLPEKYIIAQVGHSSASITKAVYDHLSAEKQSKYANDIARHFSVFE